jgi:hypothetical protein
VHIRVALHLEAGPIRCVRRGLESSLVIGQKAEFGPDPFTPRGQADLMVWIFLIKRCMVWHGPSSLDWVNPRWRANFFQRTRFVGFRGGAKILTRGGELCKSQSRTQSRNNVFRVGEWLRVLRLKAYTMASWILRLVTRGTNKLAHMHISFTTSPIWRSLYVLS